MAYKSLIDYYGGGMVKPSKGYQLGGLVAGARRQRDYSGEMRSLQEAAERAAESRRKVGGNLLRKLAVGTAGTLLGGPAGAAAALAGDQALRERAYKKADFSGGKYAQDIRGELGKQESQFKDQGLARVGIAGVEGYMGGKSSGMFGKAASGVKGGIGQLKDIAGFLKEGGTLGDVLGGYAQKAGESGILGQGTALQRKAFDIASKRGIAPSVPREAIINTTDEQDFQQWAGVPSQFAMGVNKTDEQDFQEWAGRPSDFAMGVNTTDEQDFQEWTGGIPSQPMIDYDNIPAQGGEMLLGAGEREPLTQSSVNVLYPELSAQSTALPSLLSGMSDSQIEQASPWMDSSLSVQTAGGYTGGGGGSFGRGLMNMLMPSLTMPRIGYQDGGQVGYGTATNPEDALRQMGMGDVADDPRLQEYLEDLPQFGMGYKQQLGDITAGARSSLMDISQQGRMQQAGTGFAGGGAGTMGQSRARQQLQRGFGSQRRGLVEGYQADLLSAIADIEGKGGFEFGDVDTEAQQHRSNVPTYDPNWQPPESPTQGTSYTYNGDNWEFQNGEWVNVSLYDEQSDRD